MNLLLAFPMQPLMDNLEAQTYETFEKDTMKYIQVYFIWIENTYIMKYLRITLFDRMSDAVLGSS